MRVLIAGWFSFNKMGATAGDLLTRDLVSGWLEDARCPHDVALARPFEGGVDWQTIDATAYSHVVFVCGPIGNGWPVTDFFARFAGRKFIGLNLSMIQPLETWNPFDLLLERDSSAGCRPDLVFSSKHPLVPVAGLVLIHPQLEYHEKSLSQVANDAIHHLVAQRHVAAVNVDTRLDLNSTGLRTAAEVESVIARMDVVLTSRLHGLVLALKNGVPAVAIDPVRGGAKICRQGRTLGWPYVFAAESLDENELLQALDSCLKPESRVLARECGARAEKNLVEVRERFLSALIRETAGDHVHVDVTR